MKRKANMPGSAPECAALYLAGALTVAEAAAFETAAAVAGSAEAKELAGLAAVAEALASSCPPAAPRAEVRGMLLARAKADASHRSGPPPFGERPAPAGITTLEFESQPWRESGVGGVRFKVLHLDRASNRATAVYEMDAGCTFPDHHHDGTEELFVIRGDMYSGGRWLGPGDFQRAEPGTDHGPAFTRGGCRVLIAQPIPPFM